MHILEKSRLKHKAELKENHARDAKKKIEQAREEEKEVAARVQHEIEIEKDHEHEMERLLRDAHQNTHDRLQARIRRRSELKERAKTRRIQKQRQAAMLWAAASKEKTVLAAPSLKEKEQQVAGDDALIVEMKRKIHSLEQDLVSSSAVRKRLEQELSSLRTATQENAVHQRNRRTRTRDC